MKLRGEKSNNIEDMRSYFGTAAFDPDYWTEDRYADFLRYSLSASPDAPQQFQPSQPPPLDVLMNSILLGKASRSNPAGIWEYSGGVFGLRPR